ncbi:transcription antitermination factor NusB [Psychrobacter glacincola]|uniref:transcription antitermination factor NusB n=1 Tax=Psychrobacter glacincola TaxID=56810 RepID=UPI003BB6377E
MTDQLKRAISAAKTAQTNDSQAEATRIASSSAGDQTFDMSESSYKTSHTAIRKARRFAMQGLYEWLVTDRRFDIDGKLGWKANTPHDIAARTRATNAMHTVHISYYHEMMRDIPEQIEALDALISQHLDREIDKLDTVEHAILLIGAYELQNRLEIPYKVVLDEAMKLNNHFGATDAHKLINAVLDRMAIELRDIEVQADSKANLRTSQKSAIKKAAVPTATQVETTENAIDTDNNSQSTASSKKRISANNSSIKRNSASKALANITDYKASKQSDTQSTLEETIIEPASIEPVSADKANDIAASAENIINDQPVEENVTDSNDNTASDVELVDSKIVNVDIKDDKSENVELNDTDEKSQD